MAHHASAKKRIRQNEARRLHNRYYAVTMRNEEEAEKSLPLVSKMIDKLAKRNVIHKNKAANLKSKLAQHVNKLGKAA